MHHKTRFLIIFIMVLAVGTAFSLVGMPAQAAAKSNLVVSANSNPVNFIEAGGANSFTINIQETQGVAADPPAAANSIPGFTIPAGQHAVAFTLPAGITYSSFAAGTAGITGCTATGQNVVCLFPAGQIPANANVSFTVTVSVLRISTPNGNFQVQITQAANGETSTLDNVYTQNYTVTTKPDLITSRVEHAGDGVNNGSNFIVGTQGTITATIQNTGLGATSGQMTADFTIPSQVTFVSGATAGWNCSANTAIDILCTSTNVINSGGIVTVTINVNPTATGGPFTASETISGGSEPGAYVDASNTAQDTNIRINGNPHLTVAKSHTDPFLAGTTGVYHFVVTNNGTGPTTAAIKLTDNLPGGMTFASYTPVFPAGDFDCSASAGSTINCTSSVALPNTGANTVSVDVTVNVPIGAPASVTNNVLVQTTGSTDATAADPTNIKSVTLTVAKSHVDPFVAGVAGQKYSIVVTNTGTAATQPTTAGTIVVKDNLPAGITFVSSPSANFTCGAVAQVVTCNSNNGFSLAAGGGNDTIDLIVAVSKNATSGAINSVTADAPGSPTASANDAPTTIQKADLQITKTASSPFQVGPSGGSYTIAIKNVGNGLLPAGTVVTVNDNLDASTPYISDSGWGANICTGAPNLACTFTVPVGGLAPNASLPPLVITVSPSSATAVINTATATESANVDPTTPNSSTITTNVTAAPVPVLDVVKASTIAPAHTATASFTVGAASQEYTITVRNVSGIDAAPNAGTVTDNLPTGITAGVPTSTGTGTWTCGVVGATVTCHNTTTFTATSSANIYIPITVAAAAGANAHNDVTVVPGNPPSNDFQLDTPINPAAEPDLTVSKTHAGNFIKGSSPNTYTVTVTNIGNAPTDNTQTISVVDTLPTGFTFVAFTGAAPWSCAAGVGNQVNCSATLGTVISNVAPGNTSSFTFTVQAAATAGNYTNNVTVNYTGTEVTTGNNNGTDPTVVSAANTPDLSVTKTHTDPFTANDQINSIYTITVANIGTGAATPVGGPFQVTDTLPNGFQYIAGGGANSWTCTPPGPAVIQVVCTNSTSTLAAGGSPGDTLGALTITVKPGSPTNGTPVNNMVTLQHLPAGDASTLNNSDTDPTNVIGIGDLQIVKTAVQNFQYGQQGTYNITVTNIGSATIAASAGSPITVTDTLATGLTFVSGSGGGFLCTAVGQAVTCDRVTSMTSTGANSTGTIALNVNVATLASGLISGGQVNNQANIAQPIDTNPYGGQNSSVVTTPVTNGNAPDLVISKTHVGAFVVGQQGQYQLTVKNQGTSPETGAITVIDTLNPSLSFVSGNSPGGFSCSGGPTVTCTRPAGSLTNGASDIITLTVNVASNASTSTPITNQASVSVTPNDEATTSNNTSNNDSVTPTTKPPVSPTLSTVCANPRTGLLSNGSDTTVVTVTVKDTTGVAQGSVPVQLNLSQNPSSMGALVSIATPNPGTTNAGGQVQFFVTAINPGTVTFTATANSVTFGSSGCGSTATFGSTNGMSITNSTLTANPAAPTTIALNSSGTVTAHIADVNNVSVPGAGVTLTYTTNTGNSTGITPASGSTLTTDASGNAVFTITSTTNQTLTFTATALLNGITITLSQHPQMIFGNGGTSSTTTLTFSTNYISIPADNIATATLTANIKDSSGNPISGKTVTVAGNPALSGMTISPASAVTDASGNAAFTVRSTTQGGPVTFTATDSTDNLTFPTIQITFTAPGTAPVAAPNATATPGGGTAGTVSTGTVIVRLMCIRTGPGFGYSRYGSPIKFGTVVTVLGKTVRVPGIAARDGCIHLGGPTWLFIQLPDNSIAWANANLIRIGSVAFRGLPVLPAPPAPGQAGAGQAATTGIAGEPPKK